MNKKVLLLAVLLVLAAAATALYWIKNNDHYQDCVSRGGKVSHDIAPSVCVEGNKTYYDGEY